MGKRYLWVFCNLELSWNYLWRQKSKRRKSKTVIPTPVETQQLENQFNVIPSDVEK